ncbi:MAG: aromatic ring-hydroxylating dioxygenase subunit alpha [Gemmataceae bacterium]
MNTFDPSLPLERAQTIPSDWYFDSVVFEREKEMLFARGWQCVGRAEQVARPGQYFTVDLAGESILVVRDDAQKLGAFYNVCRHRAAPLLTDESGCTGKLRCQYHGWTYDLAGRLKGTPEFDGVCEFAREKNGLVPVGGVAVWGPFVWVCLEKPTQTLDEFLNPLPVWAERTRPFDSLRFHSRIAYNLACNWKVYVDNYLDGGYHVNTIHPALAGVLDYSGYTTVPDGHTVLQSSPLKPGEGEAGRTRTGTEAAYWWVSPNVMFNFYSGIMDVNLVQPMGPERCRVLFDFYFAEGTDPAFAEESIRVAHQVQLEDGEICEQVQKNLHSRSYSTGRFSVKRENGGYHFHRLLAAALQANRAGPVD